MALRVAWLHGACSRWHVEAHKASLCLVPRHTSSLQLDQSERLQQWLAGLPASLQALAVQAAAQAAALQQQHGFSLQGLELMLQGQAGGAAAPGPAAAPGGGSSRSLTGSLLLTASPPQQEQEERRQYAGAALRRFQAKLHGQQGTAAAAAAATAAGPAAAPGALPQEAGSDGSRGGSAAGVEEEVRRLIAAATSADNLARMWEGWMPWV